MIVRRAVDLLSILVVAVGVGQVVATPLLFVALEEPAAWFAAGGLSLILVGLLTRASVRHSFLPAGVHVLATLAAAVAGGFWLLLVVTLNYKFQRYPVAYGAAAIVVGNGIAAVLHSLTRNASRS
jgi:hypothetical protein